MRIHFNGSPTATVGVEVELQIIDPETKNLVSGAFRILERVTGINRVKLELIASTIELNTDVCANVEMVRCELSDRLRSLLALCDELGYELACVGTHLFSRWAEQDITQKERYHLLVNRCAQHLYPPPACAVGQLAHGRLRMESSSIPRIESRTRARE